MKAPGTKFRINDRKSDSPLPTPNEQPWSNKWTIWQVVERSRKGRYKFMKILPVLILAHTQTNFDSKAHQVVNAVNIHKGINNEHTE